MRRMKYVVYVLASRIAYSCADMHTVIYTYCSVHQFTYRRSALLRKGYVDITEPFTEVNKRKKKSNEITSKIREINTVQRLYAAAY